MRIKKSLIELNILIIFFFYIFFLIFIPNIPINTYNIDDKLWYFLQSELIFINHEAYINLFSDINFTCNESQHCLNWLNEFRRSNFNYILTGIIGSLIFNFLEMQGSNLLLNISTTYYLNFLILFSLSFFIIFITYYKTRLGDNFDLYFLISLLLIIFLYYDGIYTKIIIKPEIFYSYLPTNYAPRGAMSVLFIGIFFLLINNNFYPAIFSSLILILYNSGQAFVINLILVFYYFLIFLKEKKISFFLIQFVILVLNFIIIMKYPIFQNSFEGSSINNFINYLANLKFKDFFLILAASFFIFQKNIFFYNKLKRSNKEFIILLGILELNLITSFYIQDFFIKLFYLEELNVVSHSLGQFFYRYFSIALVPILSSNYLLIINSIKQLKKIKILFNFNFYSVFFIFFVLIFFKFTFKNFDKTFFQLNNFQYELSNYINRKNKYIMEENFNPNLKKFYKLSELQKMSLKDINRPDINDPEFLMVIFFELRKINNIK